MSAYVSTCVYISGSVVYIYIYIYIYIPKYIKLLAINLNQET